MPAVHLLIAGRVQGVGYRAWCHRVARELALVGWVRNLDDGRVEVFAQGERAALEELVARCSAGPTYAEVTDVARAERATRALSGFLHAADAAAPEPDVE